MSVASNDFSDLPLQDAKRDERGDPRESVTPLPPLTEEQVERLEHLMARGDLPHEQDDGRGAGRMLGAVALVGLAMVAGAAYGLWRYLIPVVAGL